MPKCQLTYLWLENYRCFKNVGFNLSPGHVVQFIDGKLTADSRDYFDICSRVTDEGSDDKSRYIKEVVGIIGKNGSGKSTLFRAILHLFQGLGKQQRSGALGNYFAVFYHSDAYHLINHGIEVKKTNFNLIDGFKDGFRCHAIYYNHSLEDIADNSILTAGYNGGDSDRPDIPYTLLPDKRGRIIRLENEIQAICRGYLFIDQSKGKIKGLSDFFKPSVMEIELRTSFPSLNRDDLKAYFSKVEGSKNSKEGQINALEKLLIPNEDERLKLIGNSNLIEYWAKAFIATAFMNHHDTRVVEQLDSYLRGTNHGIASKHLDLIRFANYLLETISVDPSKYPANMAFTSFWYYGKMDRFPGARNGSKLCFDIVNDGNLDEKQIKVLKFVPSWLAVDLIQDKGTDEELRFSQLSSGEQAMLRQFALIDYEMVHTGAEIPVLLLMDEADLGLHPEWQRRHLSEIIRHFGWKDDIQLLYATHSPIVASDLPRQSILLLNDGESVKPKKSFGANIHTLYQDSFFLKTGVGGELSSGIISDYLERFDNFHNASDNLRYARSDQDKKKYKEELQKTVKALSKDLPQLELLLEEIGEPILVKIFKRNINDLKEKQNEANI